MAIMMYHLIIGIGVAHSGHCCAVVFPIELADGKTVKACDHRAARTLMEEFVTGLAKGEPSKVTKAFDKSTEAGKAMSEFFRVLKDGGVLLIVDFDYPSNRNRFGYWLTKLMESAGDTIRNIPKLLQQFPCEFTEEEIGGFGSVHFYKARKKTGP